MNEFLKYLKMIPVIIYPYIYVLILAAGSFQVFSGTQLQPRLRCSVHCRRTINR